MSDLQVFGERLKAARVRLGLSQEQFCARVGVSKGSQIQYEGGKTAPNAEYLLKIKRLGVDVAGLFGGKSDIEAITSGAIGPLVRARDQSADDHPDLDLVQVHEIDLAYGLGGTYSDGPVDTHVLHFPRTWLESITKTPPSQLTFARGRGDSMMPTMLDGDIVLIDRSQRSVREQDAIWAFTVGDIAMIKRLRVRSETVHILSDNDRVPPDEAHAEEVNVVGRVVFIGRRI